LPTRFALALLVLALATPASAQYGWGGHSSTLEEGIQRGAADLVRSQGMANLYNAQAATQAEQGRSQYIENNLKATQTYFEMKRVNDEYRRSKDTSPLSMEQYVRIARQQAPDPLGTSQLDPLTGAIGWPMSLRKPEYDALRKKIESLFQRRASGYAEYSGLAAACTEFLDQLKADLPKFDPNDYVKAKKFLESLTFAARTTPS
jgi:hypothetical protein